MVFMHFMPLATCLPVFDAIEKVALVDYSRDCFAAGWPGVARQLVPFLCFAKEKEPKERRPAVWGPVGATCEMGENRGSRANSLRSNKHEP